MVYFKQSPNSFSVVYYKDHGLTIVWTEWWIRFISERIYINSKGFNIMVENAIYIFQSLFANQRFRWRYIRWCKNVCRGVRSRLDPMNSPMPLPPITNDLKVFLVKSWAQNIIWRLCGTDGEGKERARPPPNENVPCVPIISVNLNVLSAC